MGRGQALGQGGGRNIREAAPLAKEVNQAGKELRARKKKKTMRKREEGKRKKKSGD